MMADPAQRERALKELEPYFISHQMAQQGQGVKASANTKQYLDGTTVFAQNDGTVRVVTPDQREVSGPDAQAAIQSAMQNEITYMGDRSGAQASAREGAATGAAFAQAMRSAMGDQFARSGQGGGPSEADIERDKAGAKTDATAAATRAADTITLGVDAARSIPIFKRAQVLLQTVETGGFDKVKVDAKKWFGIESANEAEFSNLLGKQVIAQIKPTFGAAPTVKEGEWLRSMESGWGTSTAGNKRLIENGLRLAERRAEAGQQRALERKDKGTFDEIEGYRNFSYDAPAQGTGGKKVVRTGKDRATGRPVVQYDDGTVEVK
jgi:hypothetical protein